MPLTDVPLVCVIDDDESVQRALVRLIVSMGYRCVGYASAQAGLDSGQTETAACILTDIHMPGLDGFALKQLLDGRGCEAVVIMMTGRGDGRLELRAIEAGAFCLLRKPLHADTLAACLRRVLSKDPL